MDIDEDDSDAQQVKRVPDHSIQVDFSGLDEEDLEVFLRLACNLCLATQLHFKGGTDAIAELDAKIVKINADIERMAPNMKAVEK